MLPKIWNDTTQGKSLDSENSTIRVCKVTSVVLDDTHKLFNDLGGWNSIGYITFAYLDEDTSALNLSNKNVKDNIAIPLNPNIKSYPLQNELVYTVVLPTIPQPGAVQNSTLYYFTSINILNSPHQNSYVLQANNKTLKFNSVGIPFRNIRETTTKITLGENFKENTSVRPLLSFEGDYIVEGRHGNSIRFGGSKTKFSTQWQSDEQANYVIISGRSNPQTENIHVIENMNEDDYIISGFANHQINIDLPSLNFLSYNITITNNLEGPEQLYEPNTNQSESSSGIDPASVNTTIVESSVNTSTVPVTSGNNSEELFNEAEGDFTEQDYVYVLDETTVNERANVYTEQPDYLISNINVVPVNYVTFAQFSKICGSPIVGAQYFKSINQALTLYKINTNKRIAHFLSQCLIESANFTRFVEIGSVSYFSKYESGGNQLGNTQPGDGYKFRGRGAIQITGKWNYNALFRDLKIGSLNSPESVASNPLNIISAGWYWNMRRLNSYADIDDFSTIRYKVQGTRTNRISDIKNEYNKIIKILGNGTA